MTFHYSDSLGGDEGVDLSSMSTTHSSAVFSRYDHIIWEKLKVPDCSGLIGRKRLIDLLDRSSKTYSSTLMIGRSGTGKTMAAATFGMLAGRTAWYGLGPADIEWTIFAPHFAASVLAHVPDGPVPAEPDGPAAIEHFIDGLGLPSLAHRLIVIDDIHHVFDAPWFGSFFAMLPNLLPSETHLLLSCRSKPPAPLWRMRSKQVLNVIDEKQLAFDADETSRLFAACGIERAEALRAHTANYGRVAKLVSIARGQSSK